MKAAAAIAFVLAVALVAVSSVEGATRYSDSACYETEKACSTAALRKSCPLNRWQCREQGFQVNDDTDYPQITGECDKQGPGIFCKTEEEAKACNADQDLCRKLGYWHF